MLIYSLRIMKKQLILFLMLAMVLGACNKKAQSTGQEAVNEQAPAKTENTILRLPTLHAEDTVMSGKNVYALMIHREACDSLGIVTDELGYRYADNLLKISVKKNGAMLFSRTFQKKDFLRMLDNDFAEKSILDGCRFMQVHEGMVSYALAVSYPDSDMSRPFKLNIGPDGSYMIVKYDDLEDEYDTDSLSFDGV